MTIRSLTCLSLLLLLAVAAGAQTTMPIEIEAGYRWTEVSGTAWVKSSPLRFTPTMVMP